MATITLLRSLAGTQILSSNIFDGLLDLDFTTRTSTRLTLVDGDDRLNFIGTGISYQMLGNDIVGINSGTITQMTITNSTGSVTELNWSGVSISAPAFFDYLAASNWTSLNTLLWGTSDSYNLTNGRDQARGFGGNDVMHGFSGDDRLFGDQGNDKLFGDQGNDVLRGGTGADTLIGGAGLDTLTGDAGADVFAFLILGAINRDIVTDFNGLEDELHFDNAAFTAFSYTGQLRRADFVAGTVAADGLDRFIYQKSTGSLWYDADGSGAGAKVLVAELVDGTVLTPADVLII